MLLERNSAALSAAAEHCLQMTKTAPTRLFEALRAYPTKPGNTVTSWQITQ